MTFAIPTTDPMAIRCNTIIDRLVNSRPGSVPYDEAAKHAADWISSGEAFRHPHPFIALEADAIIRALMEKPENPTWLAQGAKWLEASEKARRTQGYYQPDVITLPECRNTADLVGNNID